MVNDRELAALIARDIFKVLDEPNDICQRIQGRGGTYPGKETDLGGLCEQALTTVIEKSLSAHRSY